MARSWSASTFLPGKSYPLGLVSPGAAVLLQAAPWICPSIRPRCVRADRGRRHIDRVGLVCRAAAGWDENITRETRVAVFANAALEHGYGGSEEQYRNRLTLGGARR